MKYFNITFRGRKRGAIGIYYPICAEAQGIDADAAVLSLYGKYDLYMAPRRYDIIEVLKPLNKIPYVKY